MLEDNGDLWSYPAHARCVTTNGVLCHDRRLVMGAGVALQAADRYPELPLILGHLVRKGGNNPYYIYEYNLISFPTKHHWRDRSDLALVERSARLVKGIADDFELGTVTMPRIGTGCGGLLWRDVRPILEDYFDDRFIVLSPI